MWSTSVALLGFAVWGSSVMRAGAQDAPAHRDFNISAGNFQYDPPRLVIRQDDLVKVSFHAVDIAHSFTVDAYRIAKRAAAGQTVVFEFRADQPGTFPIYCNLSNDSRCRQMLGELVVTGK
jgi:heme/copper-type cytochrome/quinol oxidase subunit 2